MMLVLSLLNRQPLQYATAKGEDGAHLDVVGRDFGAEIRRQCAFLMSPLYTPIFTPQHPGTSLFINQR